jgi:hypothetical protein
VYRLSTKNQVFLYLIKRENRYIISRRFLKAKIILIIPQRHAIHLAPNHRFHIVHPYLMMDWLHQGQMPELVEN